MLRGVVLAGAIFLSIGAILTPTASASRHCGSIAAQGSSFFVTIKRGHVTCKGARGVMRDFLSGKSTHAWRCGTASSREFCFRHGSSRRTARDYVIAEAQGYWVP